jgi:hypothetical protein
MNKNYSELVEHYCPDTDTTFITEETYDSETGEINIIKCVGWYFGTPNDTDTRKYANGDMVATFN